MRSGVSWRFIASILWLTGASLGCDEGRSSGALAGNDADAANGAAGATRAAGAGGAAGVGGAAGADAASAAGAAADESALLSFNGGRITNSELDVHGVIFAESDSHTAENMTSNLTPPVARSVVNACIKGTASQVDRASEPCILQEFTPPALDCFDEYWGADIAMHLNQELDTAEGGTPAPFDASALKGFSFEIDGATVPANSALRFEVQAGERMFCSGGVVRIGSGFNRVLFSQLPEDCFKQLRSDESRPTAQDVQSGIIKVSWRVVTNSNAEVPFDFCVSNVRALLQ